MDDDDDPQRWRNPGEWGEAVLVAGIATGLALSIVALAALFAWMH